jgi:hypothetical protein
MAARQDFSGTLADLSANGLWGKYLLLTPRQFYLLAHVFDHNSLVSTVRLVPRSAATRAAERASKAVVDLEEKLAAARTVLEQASVCYRSANASATAARRGVERARGARGEARASAIAAAENEWSAAALARARAHEERVAAQRTVEELEASGGAAQEEVPKAFLECLRGKEGQKPRFALLWGSAAWMNAPSAGQKATFRLPGLSLRQAAGTSVPMLVHRANRDTQTRSAAIRIKAGVVLVEYGRFFFAQCSKA